MTYSIENIDGVIKVFHHSNDFINHAKILFRETEEFGTELKEPNTIMEAIMYIDRFLPDNILTLHDEKSNNCDNHKNE